MKNAAKARTWWAVFVDYVGFGAGLTFAHTGTVLPAYAATLTNSKVLIGLVGTVWLGAWLLPQLFAANFLSSKPRKYGYMVKISAIGRPVFWLFALLLAVGWLKDSPGVLLAIFLVSLAWFSATDAVVAICWFDIYGRALDPKERGQLIGIGQVVDGFVAIGAGALVALLLSERGPIYPYNYAAIFGLAGFAFLISWIGITFMVEIPEDLPPEAGMTDWRQLWAKLVETWQSEPRFSRAIFARLLLGLGEMAAPFYIIHATQVAHVDESLVGSLAAVGSIGSALAGLWLGRVAARQGSHRVIQFTTLLALIPPGLGLLAALSNPTPALVALYLACYLILGMINGSSLLGYFNYILDLAPPGGRPIFMGIANTIGGLLVVAPVLGGWLLERSSYAVLFVVTLAGVAGAAFVARGLRPASHLEPAATAAADQA